ncbi:hypothetical protein Pyn_08869 [Prunus yedoensis var. nudiflora]|uniref:Uncharacterized protein n=1 Tax=Prunus yedoensis var. nudiflora TaxID=2094558 RepID=A0A314ZH74_PRUYE|nr:hypothetical protein Pyn_08869 [Prunus yedoensis var. nudiflora]
MGMLEMLLKQKRWMEIVEMLWVKGNGEASKAKQMQRRSAWEQEDGHELAGVFLGRHLNTSSSLRLCSASV